MFLLANTNPLQQVLQYWVCQRTCRVCISLSFYCIVYLLLPLCFFVDLSLSLFVLPLFRLYFISPQPPFSQTFSPSHSDSISLFGSLRDSFPPPDLLSDSFFAFLSNYLSTVAELLGSQDFFTVHRDFFGHQLEAVESPVRLEGVL